MKIAGGVLVAVLLLIGAVAATVWSGVIDMSATTPAGFLERTLGSALADRSVARRAPKVGNPLGERPEAVQAGLEHYRDDCLACHGAPGLPRSDLSRGLNPPAPDLSLPDSQGSSDGELFEVIAHGVRMTGMPAWSSSHSEKEIWELVSFVRHLPALSPTERQALARAGLALSPPEQPAATAPR